MQKPSKKGLYISACGTGLVALCCFTPILVISIVAIGLGSFTPYLDFVLYPALAILIITTIVAYSRWKKECRTCLSVTEEVSDKNKSNHCC